MTNPEHAAPDGLGKAGAELWLAMTDGIEYRPDEAEVLRQACRLADTVAALEAELAGEPMTSAGSRGQTIVNPLVPELRLSRSQLTAMLLRIDVPAEDDGLDRPMTRSEAARVASRARWHGAT
jgi:hypothetical protein